MKLRPIFLLFSLILSFLSSLAFPQSGNSMPGINQAAMYDKLYLHTDRDYYFQGDTIWFKAYYLDGQTHQLLPGVCNIFTELLDQKGVQVHYQAHFVDGGTAWGRITLPDTLEPGPYLLRAYSDYQVSIGEDLFFYKKLNISEIRSSEKKDSPTELSVEDSGIDLAFLPEGGILLENSINVAGIKVMDEKGKSLLVHGKIVDGKDLEITSFTTGYKGMDTVHFRPLKGEKYRIVLEEHPDFQYEITGARSRGIKIEFAGKVEDELLFQVTTNSESLLNKNNLFAIMHRGQVIFQKEYTQSSATFPIRISPDALPAGINRFILLDASLVPLSERLYFSKNLAMNQIRIESDQERYSTRSPVKLSLSDDEEMGGMAWSELSMSVVNLFAVDEYGKDTDILSWLLINSELKGPVESPSDFFLDDPEFSSSAKLELLMLTQGWRSYLWNTMTGEIPSIDFPYPMGLSLNGRVKRVAGNKGIPDGLVVCNIFSEEGYFSEQTTTDMNGRFSFRDLYFTDTVNLFIQGFNQKGGLYTRVDLDPVLLPQPAASERFLPVPESGSAFPEKLYEQNYYNDLALRNYAMESGSILLDEVTMVGKRKLPDDGHPRMYGKPTTSFKITEKDLMYQNVFQYLEGRVTGLNAPPGSFSSGPAQLLMLDGQVINDKTILESIPMSDVDVIDVIKHYDVAGTAMFGTRGGGKAVISVFTKNGAERFVSTYTQGTLALRIAGFASCQEFYSPKYTAESIHSERPDRRITLYWNPDIKTDEGQAEVSFFTSDEVSRYRVVVEGITNAGEICLGSSLIEVTSRNPLLLGE
jgi:hypothetical protein